jgi:hypothetical protein
VEIVAGHLKYEKHFEMPSQSQKEIPLAILIYEPVEELKFNIYEDAHKESVYSGKILLKAVAPNRFLIGVENKLYDSFVTEFSRYTEAAKHSYFVAINPAQLPDSWQLLEAMDLLVLSDESLRAETLKATLDLWQAVAGGNLFVKDINRQFSLQGITQFKPRLHGAPSEKLDIYNAFGKTIWLTQNKEALYKYLVTYFLFSIAVLLIWFWIKENNKNLLIVISVLVGANIMFVALIFAFCLIPPDFTSDGFRITTLNQKEKVVEEEIITTVNPLKGKTISINLNTEFARIIYPDIKLSAINQIFNFVMTGQGKSVVKAEAMRKHTGIMIEEKKAWKTDISVSVTKRTLGETIQYKLINAANSDLSDSFLVTADRSFYIGTIKSGEVRNISLEKKDFMNLGELINKYFSEGRQKRLLEAYLKGKNIGDSLIGWNYKAKILELMIIKIE